MADDILKNPKLCATCGKEGCNLRCPCQEVNYCDRKCQKSDWPNHKKMCSSAAGKKVQETTNTAQTQQGSKYVPELGKNIVTDPAVAAAQHHAGNVHVAGGRYAEGEKCLLEALQIYMWSDDQASFANSPSVMTDLGQVYFLMGKHDRCMEVLGKARELFRIGFGPRSAGEAMTLQMMARSIGRGNRPDSSEGNQQEAIAKLDEAYSIFKEKFGADHGSVAACLADKAVMLRLLHRYDEALKLNEEALKIIVKESPGGVSAQVATTIQNIGTILADTGRLEEAREKYEESLSLLRRIHGGRDHPDVATALNNIADNLEKQRRWDEAYPFLEKVLKMRRRLFGDNHVVVAQTLASIGFYYRSTFKYDKAVETLTQCIEMYELVMGKDKREHAKIYMRLAQSQHKLGETGAALGNAENAVRLYRMHGLNDQWSREAEEEVRLMGGAGS